LIERGIEMEDVREVDQGLDEALAKAPTGIRGFDEITGGGLPQGRPTLVAGGPGCGKTLFGMEFLVRGATQFGESGVFVSFEESEKDLVKNVKSLGFDLKSLTEQEKIITDYVHIEPREILETGEYDLDGLFVRLADSIDAIGARRVVLDTLEALFSGLPNESILRSEIRRLFRWLKDRGITAVVTAEKGRDTLTRYGLEEYISDCVIFLDHRVTAQMSTRRLRIVKYRGSIHGTNEYPFLIDERGISILPITSVGLDYKVSSERVPTGIPRLDAMLGGEGFYRGSSVLVSGTAGTGKTSIAAHFADAACARGGKCLYFAFEESESQIVRNMQSIGLDLDRWIKRGLLRFHAARPTAFGLEMHLVSMHKTINELGPSTVIVDPVTNLVSIGDPDEVKMLLMRLVDLLKQHRVTSLFTSLVTGGEDPEGTSVGVSSLMDSWILVRDIETEGERNRGLYVIKSRGMAHSNQVREFLLTDHGVELLDVYVGPAGVLTGAARASQEARDRVEEALMRQETERKLREIELRRKMREAQIAALQADSESDAEEEKRIIAEANVRRASILEDRERIAHLRKADYLETIKAEGKRGGSK
jgi:circadian clock protein KaiC